MIHNRGREHPDRGSFFKRSFDHLPGYFVQAPVGYFEDALLDLVKPTVHVAETAITSSRIRR